VVRQGPVVGRAGRRARLLLFALAGGVAVSAWAAAQDQTPAKEAPAPKAATPPAPASAAQPGPPVATESIDRLPYRIRVLLATEPEARLDGPSRNHLIDGWLTLVRRFVGAPWQIEVVGEDRSGPLVLGVELETLEPGPIEALAGDVDKVWLIRVGAAGSGLVFSGREYDVATRRLGPLQLREAAVARDAPRVLFRFSRDLFAPYAVIGERFAKDVNLIVRGASLEAASPIGRVVVEGAFFQPFRVAVRKDAPPLVQELFFTYLRVESAEPPGARCSFVSSFSDPFTRRVVQKASYVALGVKPGKSPTRLKFLTKPDRVPAAGYVLTVRKFPDGAPREMGLTDREGRIELPPGFADGLVVVRLLAGSDEPVAEFPLIPGESTGERVVPPFDPLAPTVALETRLDSLRDTVIDLVAVRARLLSRLKARFDGEKWDDVEAALKEYATLPVREVFASELTRLKDEAARLQAKVKTPILTKTAQARVADLQNLIERYLDDEEFNAYREALDKLETKTSKKPGVPIGKAAPAALPAPTVTPPPPATPAAPAPAPSKPAGADAKKSGQPAVPF
jgi:hypothetical protein